jgi:outer membrane protein assembly factor BamB
MRRALSLPRPLGSLALLALLITACGPTEPLPVAPVTPASSAIAAPPGEPTSTPIVPASAAPTASASAVAEVPKAPSPAALAIVKALPVGLWPEGVALHDGDAFVAESGDRKIARVELATGKIKARIAAGRLPVELDAGPDGTVYALAHTDQNVLAIDPATNRARAVAHLPDYPQDLKLADGALWVLLWDKQSSADSTVVRVDPKNGKQTRSAKLGKSAWSLAVGGGRVWVAHDDRISVLDEITLEKKADLAIPSGHHALVAGAGAVFTDLGTRVAQIDLATQKIMLGPDLGEPTAALAIAGSEVLAAGRKGHVWRLDAATLTVKATLSPEAPFTPQAIAARGDTIVVTTHDSRDAKAEHGTLLVIGPQ